MSVRRPDKPAEPALDLDLVPEASPGPNRASVVAARHRRALVAGLREGRTATAAGERTRAATQGTRETDLTSSAGAPGTGAAARPLDQQAVVVPAGALLHGYVRASSLLLAGDLVGNVHCTAGPVVVRAGATLRGRLVCAGDVFVCGKVCDDGGGAVIATPGKLTLAAGARVEGDVRSGLLDLHGGATLVGVARAYQD